MKTLKTIELAGNDLLTAVAIALRTSYDDLANKVRTMDLEQLQYYLRAYPEIPVDEDARTSEERLRDIILGHHEPLLPGEDDLRIATEEDLWPLCEVLLDRYNLDLGPRYRVGQPRKVWLVDDEDGQVYGDSPKQAILRYYVKLKLGDEVTIDD